MKLVIMKVSNYRYSRVKLIVEPWEIDLYIFQKQQLFQRRSDFAFQCCLCGFEQMGCIVSIVEQGLHVLSRGMQLSSAMSSIKTRLFWASEAVKMLFIVHNDILQLTCTWHIKTIFTVKGLLSIIMTVCPACYH